MASASARHAASLSDTTPDAAAVRIVRLREMGAIERDRLGNELSEAVVEATLRALRRRSPRASEDELRTSFLEACHGPALAAEVSRFLGGK